MQQFLSDCLQHSQCLLSQSLRSMSDAEIHVQFHVADQSQAIHGTDPVIRMYMQIRWMHRFLHIKFDQKRFSFYKLEAEVGIVRKAVCSVSVQTAVRDFIQNSVNQIISDFSFFRCSFFHIRCCTFCCSSDSYDSRNILCTCTAFFSPVLRHE